MQSAKIYFHHRFHLSMGLTRNLMAISGDSGQNNLGYLTKFLITLAVGSDDNFAKVTLGDQSEITLMSHETTYPNILLHQIVKPVLQS